MGEGREGAASGMGAVIEEGDGAEAEGVERECDVWSCMTRSSCSKRSSSVKWVNRSRENREGVGEERREVERGRPRR